MRISLTYANILQIYEYMHVYVTKHVQYSIPDHDYYLPLSTYVSSVVRRNISPA